LNVFDLEEVFYDIIDKNRRRRGIPMEKELARAIAIQGGRLYLVGGAVRDGDENCKDRDFCVTGLTASQFLDVMPGAKETGLYFPVFRVFISGEEVEIALARRERKRQGEEGHTAFDVEVSPNITIEEDLFRRDLTINAMAVDVLTGELMDPYGGKTDLENKIIRAVSEAFAEDPLRVYRAARFAAKFGFTIEEATLVMMNRLKPELASVSVERVFEEMKKVFKTEVVSLFFDMLRKADVLDVHFAELLEADTVRLARVAKETTQEEVLFAALVIQLGKEKIRSLCDRLKLPVSWKKAADFAKDNHEKLVLIEQRACLPLVEIMENARRNPLGVEGFSILCEASQSDKNWFIKGAQAIVVVKGNPDLIDPETIRGDKQKRQAKILDMM
jgi:tRNA nucleotidyltransferase (CCA-adding enzyme)